MMKTIKVYRLWDNDDPANTDEFFPTRKEAKKVAEEMVDPSDIELYKVTPTAQGICFALTHWH